MKAEVSAVRYTGTWSCLRSFFVMQPTEATDVDVDEVDVVAVDMAMARINEGVHTTNIVKLVKCESR